MPIASCDRFHRCRTFFTHVRKIQSISLKPVIGEANVRDMKEEPSSPSAAEGERFSLKAADYRTIPFDGPPATELPEWGGVAHAEGLKFILHPPLDFEIAYRIPDYLIFTPYARAVVDISVKDGPIRRQAWPAGSAFIVPPDTCVRARMAEPVEFLCIAVDPTRAETVFARVARDRPWAPQLIEDFGDPGFAMLQQELRRSLLGDPLVEPVYLETLADGMLARIGCYLAGAAIGTPAKEAISPGVLRRIVQHIEANLGEKLVVEELAEAAGLSRSHFTRAFQSATGEPPQDFIIGRRLSRARELLADTEREIAEIAVATGFSSQAHLSSTFKKRLGVTPARYRNAFR